MTEHALALSLTDLHTHSLSLTHNHTHTKVTLSPSLPHIHRLGLSTPCLHNHLSVGLRLFFFSAQQYKHNEV